MNKKIWSVLIACSLAGVSACAPAPLAAPGVETLRPAKPLTVEELRALRVMVPAPVKCSDLKYEIVNTVAGCETYGNYIDADTAYKYAKPRVADEDLYSTDPVRCLDLTPLALRRYSICRPVVVVLESVPYVPVQPAPPAPVVVQETQTANGNTDTYAVRTPDRDYTEANSGPVSVNAGSKTLSDGTKVYESDKIKMTVSPDGTTVTEFK